MEISEATLNKLAAFDTPTICNVIELFDVRPRSVGYVTSAGIRANFPDLPPVVGFAATAVARSAFPPGAATEGYPWLEAQIEGFAQLSGSAIVVIQDVDAPPVAAMFGEIMCTTYKAFGAKGVITNGAGRDIDQVADLGGFQLFTNGEICSHGYFHLRDLYTTVEIGGLVVQPDDLLHADRNGITQIPKDIAAEVADAADDFIESERVFLEIVGQPGVTLQQVKAARAESKLLQKQLQARVSRNPRL
jgi:4-hydroxy-4-methyl-2-oxoglutarate aldolase